MRYHLDYETFSALPITTGHIPYAMHESTEVLMCAYAVGNGDVKHWDASLEPIPQELVDILLDDTWGAKWAQNASFEIAITVYTLLRQCGLEDAFNEKFPGGLRDYIKTWRCSMIQGMSMSLPASLAQQGMVLNTKEVKLAESGKRLIQKFCKPVKESKHNPDGRWTRLNAADDWESFVHYNIMDVAAERANWRKTNAFAMPKSEWDLWHLDQVINFTGLPIDMDLVDSARDVDKQIMSVFKKELKNITELPNPNSRDQILPWLQEHGCEIEDVRKETLINLLRSQFGGEQTLEDDVLRAIQLRLLTNKNAIKKFKTLADCTVDGRLYGCFQFFGAARTGRWAGRKFQPQNIARGVLKVKETDDGLDVSPVQTAIDIIKSRDLDLVTTLEDFEDVPDILSSLVRPSIASPDDRVLTVADLSSIETIMLGWAANSQYMIDLFAKGIDPYCDYGVHLMGKSYEEIKADKALRNFCKPAVLGGGYRLGADGLIRYADGMGVTMNFEEATDAINVYRKSYPDVLIFWDKLEDAAMACIRTKTKVVVNGKFIFRYEKPCMTVELPSGRKLVYVRPKIENRTFKYRDKKTRQWKQATSPTVTYMGTNRYTRKWERLTTHSGKLTENLVQAIARDVLAHGLTECDKYADVLEIIGHVHDEILSLTPRGKRYENLLVDCMTRRPNWCLDAPLSSSVYQSPFYVKD